jgi:hypothetical protein
VLLCPLSGPSSASRRWKPWYTNEHGQEQRAIVRTTSNQQHRVDLQIHCVLIIQLRQTPWRFPQYAPHQLSGPRIFSLLQPFEKENDQQCEEDAGDSDNKEDPQGSDLIRAQERLQMIGVNHSQDSPLTIYHAQLQMTEAEIWWQQPRVAYCSGSLVVVLRRLGPKSMLARAPSELVEARYSC